MAASRTGVLLFGLVLACGSASSSGGPDDDAAVNETCNCESDEVCIDERCVSASCENLVLDGDESDIDCGGSCSACAEGQVCGDAGDCKSRFCNGGVCADCQGEGDCAAVAGTACIGGTCALPNGLGNACSSNSVCESGFCANGVCCSEACDGGCRSCLAADTNQVVDGVCDDVLVGTDPGGDCLGGIPKAIGCGQTGFCDGAGACAYVAEGTSCGTTCTDGASSSTLAQMECDGAGACVSASESVCPDFLKCNDLGDACLEECMGPGDCHAGHPCEIGTGLCCASVATGAGALPPECLLESY